MLPTEEEIQRIRADIALLDAMVERRHDDLSRATLLRKAALGAAGNDLTEGSVLDFWAMPTEGSA